MSNAERLRAARVPPSLRNMGVCACVRGRKRERERVTPRNHAQILIFKFCLGSPVYGVSLPLEQPALISVSFTFLKKSMSNSGSLTTDPESRDGLGCGLGDPEF